MYIGQPLNAGNLAVQTGTGDNTTTPIGSLNYSVGSSESLQVTLDGVDQIPGTDFTASGSSISFTSAVPTGVAIKIRFLALPISLPTPGDGTVTDAKITAMSSSKLTGALPAISGASLTNLPIEPYRNYVVDGDFNIWPEGTGAVTATDGDYNHALLGTYLSSTGTYTTERSTDVPTFAESGWQSQYSVLVKCTGTDASPSASEHNSLRYHITGYDFASLNQQEVTISFWCKTASANSGDTFSLFLANSAFNRSYVTDFTATNSWAKVSKTVTLDSSGTWLTDEGKGLTIGIGLQVGSTYHGTADTWEGAVDLGTSSTSNFMDSTSNEFYISQFQVVLGDSSPDFVGEPIATVQDQVGYYIEKIAGNVANEKMANAHAITTTNVDAPVFWSRQKRATPSVIANGTIGNYNFNDPVGYACTSGPTVYVPSVKSCMLRFGTAGTISAGNGGNITVDTTAEHLIIDARH